MKLERFYGILIPILSIILGMVVGAIVMLAGGYNPIDGFDQLFYGIFGEPYSIGETELVSQRK